MNNKNFNYAALEKYMKKNALSKKAFCKMCNISISTLYRMQKGSGKIRVSNIYKVAVKTHIKVDVLLFLKAQ